MRSKTQEKRRRWFLYLPYKHYSLWLSYKPRKIAGGYMDADGKKYVGYGVKLWTPKEREKWLG